MLKGSAGLESSGKRNMRIWSGLAGCGVPHFGFVGVDTLTVVIFGLRNWFNWEVVL